MNSCTRIDRRLGGRARALPGPELRRLRRVSGHASVEYVIALSLLGLVLAIDRFSAFEFLVRAMGEMYARYAFALSLP